jgi:hypothetical protein
VYVLTRWGAEAAIPNDPWCTWELLQLWDDQLLVQGCADHDGEAALLVSADGVWAVAPADWDDSWDAAAPRTPLMTRNPELPGNWVHHHEAEIFAFLRVELTDP